MHTRSHTQSEPPTGDPSAALQTRQRLPARLSPSLPGRSSAFPSPLAALLYRQAAPGSQALPCLRPGSRRRSLPRNARNRPPTPPPPQPPPHYRAFTPPQLGRGPDGPGAAAGRGSSGPIGLAGSRGWAGAQAAQPARDGARRGSRASRAGGRGAANEFGLIRARPYPASGERQVDLEDAAVWCTVRHTAATRTARAAATRAALRISLSLFLFLYRRVLGSTAAAHAEWSLSPSIYIYIDIYIDIYMYFAATRAAACPTPPRQGSTQPARRICRVAVSRRTGHRVTGPPRITYCA
jgi:hypothetical protein